jgi:hypothetical protein
MSISAERSDRCRRAIRTSAGLYSGGAMPSSSALRVQRQVLAAGAQVGIVWACSFDRSFGTWSASSDRPLPPASAGVPCAGTIPSRRLDWAGFPLSMQSRPAEAGRVCGIIRVGVVATTVTIGCVSKSEPIDQSAGAEVTPIEALDCGCNHPTLHDYTSAGTAPTRAFRENVCLVRRAACANPSERSELSARAGMRRTRFERTCYLGGIVSCRLDRQSP